MSETFTIPDAAIKAGMAGEEFSLPKEAISPQPGYLEDMAKAGAAGIGRGAAQLVGLPGTLSDLAESGVMWAGKKIGVIPEDWTTQPSALSGDRLQSALSDVTGGGSEYRGKTAPGRYAGTVGEFIPGALVPAGGIGLGTRLVTQAVAPGIGSEYSADLSSKYLDPQYEPWARLAGAILGGVAGNAAENFARKVISPGGGADPARLAEAQALRDQGIPVTAGQATGRAGILGAEADTAAGQAIAGAAPNSEQAKAFTRAAMRHIGVADDLASPQAMAAAKTDITSRMQSALQGVDVAPNMPLSLKMADASIYYDSMTPSGDKIPLIRNIISEINDAARNGVSIPGPQLAAWRSNLGELLYHPNVGVSGTAYMLRDAIDSAIENSMKAMGQPERFAAWKQARDQYRNLLAIQDALKVTRATGIEGVITPKDLMASLAKQDKSGVVTGRRGDIADLARSGMSMLAPLPREGSRNIVDTVVRRAGPLATAAGAGFGALQASQFAGFGPITSGLATAAAVSKPIYEAAKDAVRGYAMNPYAQKYLENQLLNSSTGVSGLGAGLRGAAYSIPSVLSDRPERKAGGRVGTSHEDAADRLVNAAERAKKEISRGTESLLDTPDDHVAAALEIANRSI